MSTLDDKTRFAWVSRAALVLSNLVPVWFVLFREWDVFLLVALYLMELVILGIVNVFRMAICANKGGPPDGPFIEGPGGSKLAFAAHKALLIPVFVFSYGIVMFFYTAIVLFLFEKLAEESGLVPFEGDLIQCTIPALALFGSHVVSFFVYYIGQREYRKTTLMVLVGLPFTRPMMGFSATFVMAVFAGLAGNVLVNLGIDTRITPLILILGTKIYIDLKMGDLERDLLAGRPLIARGAGAGGAGKPETATAATRATDRHRTSKWRFWGGVALILVIAGVLGRVSPRPHEAPVQPKPGPQPAAPAVQKPKATPAPSRSTAAVVEQPATTPQPAGVTQNSSPATSARRPAHERLYEYMAYEEVNALLGITGQQKRRIGQGEQARIVYEWRLEDAGVLLTGTFEKDRLLSWDVTDTTEPEKADEARGIDGTDEDNEEQQIGPESVETTPTFRPRFPAGGVVRQSPPPQE